MLHLLRRRHHRGLRWILRWLLDCLGRYYRGLFLDNLLPLLLIDYWLPFFLEDFDSLFRGLFEALDLLLLLLWYLIFYLNYFFEAPILFLNQGLQDLILHELAGF